MKKVEVIYRLRITEQVEVSEYDKEDITLEEIREWEAGNLAALLASPVGIPGRIEGKVDVSVIED